MTQHITSRHWQTKYSSDISTIKSIYPGGISKVELHLKWRRKMNWIELMTRCVTLALHRKCVWHLSCKDIHTMLTCQASLSFILWFALKIKNFPGWKKEKQMSGLWYRPACTPAQPALTMQISFSLTSAPLGTTVLFTGPCIFFSSHANPTFTYGNREHLS